MHVSSTLMVCPNCGTVIGHNSYFGGFICENCGYESMDGTATNKTDDTKPPE